MRVNAALLAAALSLSAALASAADLPTHKTPTAPLAAPEPVWNWTGVYAGLNAGFVIGSDKAWAYSSNTNALLASGSSSAPAQFRAGGQAGYRYQFPSGFVLGAFGSVGTGPNKTSSSNAVATTTSNLIGGQLEAQAGYAFGNWLPYATASWGVATFDVSRTQKLGLGAPPSYTDNTSALEYGPSIGAGLDWRVWGNWMVFSEYRYNWEQFNHLTFATAGFYQNERSRVQSGIFGVNYKF